MEFCLYILRVGLNHASFALESAPMAVKRAAVMLYWRAKSERPENASSPLLKMTA
jgi:hypothetical protein